MYFLTRDRFTGDKNPHSFRLLSFVDDRFKNAHDSLKLHCGFHFSSLNIKSVISSVKFGKTFTNDKLESNYVSVCGSVWVW